MDNTNRQLAATDMTSTQTLSELPLPHPPRCVTTQENAIFMGDKVIISLQSNKGVVIGALQNIDFKTCIIDIKVQDNLPSNRIEFKQIKRLQVTKFLKWKSANLLGITQEKQKKFPDLQEFTIYFTDGDSLKGKTLGFHDGAVGLHLFPEQHDLHYFYTFVPHTSIKTREIGQPIGQVLVQSGALTEPEIKNALNNQSDLRNAPLGELLTEHAIITTNDLKEALAQQKIAPNIRLGDLLISTRVISEEQLQDALDFQKKNREMKMGDILIQQGLVTKKQIQQSLAKKFGIPLVDLSQLEIDFDAAKLISSELARKYNVLPLMTYDNRLVVAIEDPMNSEPLEALQFSTQLMIEPVMCATEDISDYIERVYLALNTDDINLDDFQEEGEEEIDQDAINSEAISDNKIVRLANQIITDAYKQGVSDIHLEPYGREKSLIVRYRLDGSLAIVKKIPPRLRMALTARFKIMADLDIAERRKPQDGKIDFKRFGPLKIELRIATLPTAGGQEDIVMRLLNAGTPIPLADLGLNPWNIKTLKELMAQPYGLFFVCGPTGSGKTTTLHSILAHLNTPETKIWTAEDPVEITQSGLRQMQVAPKIGLTFAKAMRAFLRADPDIIMVGEMRDEETTKIGIEASLTGHLVLSTLHTNSAPESVVRLLDMGMDPFNFSDALLGILAQRLAKTLCANCKKDYIASSQEINTLLTEYCWELNIATDSPENEEKIRIKILNGWKKRFANKQGEFILYRPLGCDRCKETGYKGRLGLHELMVASDEIKLFIQKHKPVSDITKSAIRNGMRTLRQDGIEKILQGYTDLNQIKKVCIK